jgi:hypothetical protein
LVPEVPAVDSNNPLYITIKAQNDGKAVIDGERVREVVALKGWYPFFANYLKIKGIVAKNSLGTVWNIQTSNNIFQRVSGYNANTDTNDHVFLLWGNDNLLEDCAVAGTGRKMIVVYSNNAQRNTIRRCFAAWQEWKGREFCTQVWPNGTNIQLYNASNTTIENSISYGKVPRSGIELFAQDKANTAGNKIVGSISMLAGANYDGTPMEYGTRPECSSNNLDPNRPYTRNGLPLSIGWGQSDNNYLQDIFSWGSIYAGLTAYRQYHDSTDTHLADVNRATIVNHNPWPQEINGLGLLTITDSNIESTSYQGSGARLQYRYVNGVLTNEPLWPWPMEERIREEFKTHLTQFHAQTPQLQNFSVTNTIYPILAQYGAVPTEGSSDLNNDGWINRDDAEILFNNWFTLSTSSVDIYRDNRINGIDFSYLKRDWGR